jgi:ComF family protein
MLLDIIFPRRCPVCDEILMGCDGWIHEGCKRKIEYVKEPFCMKCGKSVRLERREYCHDCLNKKHYFDRGVSAFIYEKEMKKSIYRFKYKNRREYGEFYVNEILSRTKDIICSWNPEVIIPIPLHKRKMIQRGYNQAEIIGKGISRELGINMEKGLVRRINETLPQKGLSVSERKKNLEKAFKIHSDIVKYNKILLVDDIYTTGSTMDACGKALKEKGVAEVYFVTLSIGDGI